MKTRTFTDKIKISLLVCILLLVENNGWAQTFYKNEQTTTDVLHITALVNDKMDELYVHFNPAATDQFDGSYDAYKLTSLAGGLVPNLYTVDTSGTRYSINSFPFTGSDKTIDMAFTYGSNGMVTLTASGIETFCEYPEIGIYLLDTKTGSEISLRENNEYTFTYATSDEPKRFKIRFIGMTTGISEHKNPSLHCNISVLNRELDLQYNDFQGKKGYAQVFDLGGKNIKNVLLNGSGSQRVSLPVIPGLYLVKFIFPDFAETHKIVIY